MYKNNKNKQVHGKMFSEAETVFAVEFVIVWGVVCDCLTLGTEVLVFLMFSNGLDPNCWFVVRI